MKLYALLQQAIDPALSSLGFHAVPTRKWVREDKTPIREIFEVQVLKGATYTAAWGFGLDFVPQYCRGKLHWKRTSTSCRGDLWIDPTDGPEELSAQCAFLNLPGQQEPTLHEIEHCIEQTVPRALADFERVTDMTALERLFAEREQLPSHRFNFDDFPQSRLAWGLLLMALGRQREGEEKLAQFCRQVDCDREVLAPAVQAARDLHLPVATSE